MQIFGGKVLWGSELVDAAVQLDGELIERVGPARMNGRALNASGLYVLPGIVDIHGDAFERQLMPRPGVCFSVDIALKESDRQAVSNGITTVYHGVTASWEPGLRSIANARAILDAMERLRDELAADTRFHLRFETFNLDAETEVTDWLSSGRIDLLAFNDHMPGEKAPPRTRKLEQMAERSGLTPGAYMELVQQLRSRSTEVPNAVQRLAQKASEQGIPMLSHDDMSPEQRRWFRALDCRLSEFPTTVETAENAIGAGDDIVMGAPNVVRGGSHIGWIDAAEMIRRNCCTILASDYYYPAPLLAAFRLEQDGIAPLERAWALVSERPARAAGLADRGVIGAGRRADLVLVDASDRWHPVVVATITRGDVVYLKDAGRLV
jgi:alpha-D-ribose 1-methylphosphonate 5-triphosphate diphosphatase